MRIELAPANLEILKKINQEYKIPITSLANSCIYEKLGDKIKLLEFDLSLESDETELKIRLYENEREYLIKASEIIGINSLTGIIKYFLMNSIYDKRFLNPNELEAFIKFKSEISIIGKNLNQILKYLNIHKELKTDDLINTIQELNIKLDDTKQEIKSILKYTNKRFKK
ncbi:hypothetical protein PJV92_06615 [Aliarcobacter butzleri]|uniref:Uncharacterized protein n=2 Tax=Aliarcobacter butzleri TaxID=28197 RepID=A0AAP4UYL3_9BACT|nr:hypothetical protein [Aliarcobacter butzleri]KLD97989.1 hypothetical protein AA20_10130 [Aliarcobacter butzleri L348]MBF7065383.1 hypothetical protein [Aliarcobacter butzleri]MCG3717712.1 hypothetical protein [Aliarcobacter butzleri]MCT7619142.1 hypothetical protein [Aliarcobacter butzleri]MDN5047795.1 hypothetical protein [Aliarcobacter butzleri]